MQSRTTRLALSAAALLAIGVAAVIVMYAERDVSIHRTGFHSFDTRAREVSVELAGMRAAQQAYVAAGQGLAFWVPEVSSLMAKAAGSIDELHQVASSTDGSAALAEAAARVAEFGEVDARARDYLRGGEQLMAADVVFTEGSETAGAAAHQVETARLAEQQALDSMESSRRWLEGVALCGAAAVAFLVVVLLVPSVSATSAAGNAEQSPATAAEPVAVADTALGAHDQAADGKASPGPGTLTWADAALLCTDLGRVNNSDDLTRLLARASNLLDASGLVIWLGAIGGSTLRPVLAHGYSAQAVAQMPALPRSADNAAAAAYRTGRFQIVLAKPGSTGALVAPLLAADGCIGALTAEMKDGSEATELAQALASIVAAQLSGVLASSVAAIEKEAEEVEPVDAVDDRQAASRTAAG